MLNVALAKGRLADSCADIFIKCGIRAGILKEETRKLVLETPDKAFRFFFVKPADVPTYVEYGIADIGIVGKDTLLEAEADLYEMLDLNFERCKLCVAGFPSMKNFADAAHLRVATKYAHTAKKLFSSRGADVRSSSSTAPSSWRRSPALQTSSSTSCSRAARCAPTGSPCSKRCSTSPPASSPTRSA